MVVAAVDTSAGDETFAPLINGLISGAFADKLTSVEMEDLVLEDDHFVSGHGNFNIILGPLSRFSPFPQFEFFYRGF